MAGIVSIHSVTRTMSKQFSLHTSTSYKYSSPPRTNSHNSRYQGFTKYPAHVASSVSVKLGGAWVHRLKEHEKYTELRHAQSTMVEHQLTTKHKILFDKTSVLTKNKGYFPKEIYERVESWNAPTSTEIQIFIFALYSAPCTTWANQLKMLLADHWIRKFTSSRSLTRNSQSEVSVTLITVLKQLDL